MKRREFFCRLMPFGGHVAASVEDGQRQEEPQQAVLTDNERFLRAMALGVDPATVTPGQLDKLISESEPSTRL